MCTGVHLAVRILLWVGLSIVVQATSVVAVCAAALLVKWLLIGNQKRFSVIKSDDSALTKVRSSQNS